jgi:hypothetical protein
MLYNFFNKFISINQSAIFIRIADIIGKGKNLKNQLNNKAEINRVIIAVSHADILLFPQLFIFKAVLINTAVVGNHQSNQLHKFDIANQNTSLSLSNFTFVIFSAIFAEIIVSSIAIIAIVREVVKSILNNSILFSIFQKAKGF